MICHCQSARYISVIHSLLVVICSLGLDFAILLDMNIVIGLEDADFIVREFDSMNQSARLITGRDGNAHVKPLIKVNSCLISPPDDLAFSLALVSSSSLAFSFKVTYTVSVSINFYSVILWSIGCLHCREAYLVVLSKLECVN
jgi:hypothetical protein